MEIAVIKPWNESYIIYFGWWWISVHSIHSTYSFAFSFFFRSFELNFHLLTPRFLTPSFSLSFSLCLFALLLYNHVHETGALQNS